MRPVDGGQQHQEDDGQDGNHDVRKSRIAGSRRGAVWPPGEGLFTLAGCVFMQGPLSRGAGELALQTSMPDPQTHVNYQFEGSIEMTVPAIGSPVRIGLVGLGRLGVHHLERMSLRNDLQIVAACNGGEEVGSAHPLCRNVLSRMEDLLARDDLDYILIAAPQNVRGRLAVRSLEAGKNVAVEPPPCVDGNEARTMLAAARRAGRALCVLPSRREGFDFRAARQTVLGGSLGTIESARFVSWAKAVPPDWPDPAGSHGPPETAPEDGAFGYFAFQYVDQLLQLVRRPPKTVFARILSPPPSDPTAAAFFLSIGFRDGGDGLIDVNLHSGARAAHRMDACRNKRRLLPAADLHRRSVRRNLRCPRRPGRRSDNRPLCRAAPLRAVRRGSP